MKTVLIKVFSLSVEFNQIYRTYHWKHFRCFVQLIIGWVCLIVSYQMIKLWKRRYKSILWTLPYVYNLIAISFSFSSPKIRLLSKMNTNFYHLVLVLLVTFTLMYIILFVNHLFSNIILKKQLLITNLKKKINNSDQVNSPSDREKAKKKKILRNH
jgi:hypothetical protein